MLTEQAKTDIANNLLKWGELYDSYVREGYEDGAIEIVVDHYKACFGFRPYGVINKETAMAAVERCENYLAKKKQTPPKDWDALRENG